MVNTAKFIYNNRIIVTRVKKLKSDALGVAADFFSLLLSLVDGGFRRLLVDDEQGTQRGAPSFVSSFDSIERKNEGLISG